MEQCQSNPIQKANALLSEATFVCIDALNFGGDKEKALKRVQEISAQVMELIGDDDEYHGT